MKKSAPYRMKINLYIVEFVVEVRETPAGDVVKGRREQERMQEELFFTIVKIIPIPPTESVWSVSNLLIFTVPRIEFMNLYLK
jgi:hypothetical protein